jgi:carbonic anhydrase
MCHDCNSGTINRRGLIAGGLALSLAAPLAAPALAQYADTPPPVDPEEALQRLVEGNARYATNAPINTDYSVDRANRAAGQSPFAAIVSCSDSRVAPELIFDQGPGQLFVIRVAGNFLNEEGIATLEYGVAVFGIKTIVVLGHTGCGAVSATISSIEDRELPPGHLPSLVNAIRPAVYEVLPDHPADLLQAATIRNAERTAERSLAEGPILSAAMTEGRLSAKAAMYDIVTGKVTFI